jgi:hypothetical protein
MHHHALHPNTDKGIYPFMSSTNTENLAAICALLAGAVDDLTTRLRALEDELDDLRQDKETKETFD